MTTDTPDNLWRGIFTDESVRFVYAALTELANEAVKLHNCDPLTAHLLCRGLGAAVLTAPLLEGEEKYTFRWNYQGALKTMVADVDSRAAVRGFTAPAQLSTTVQDEAGIFGNGGKITVIKSTATAKLHSSQCEAKLLDVVEDLAFHFCTSDQIETAITVMVGFSNEPELPVSLCQGVMIQAMPGCDLLVFEEIRKRLAGEACRDLLRAQPLIDNHFEKIARCLLNRGLHAKDLLTAAPEAPRYQCRCNRGRILQAVRALPEQDVAHLKASGEILRIRCEFCTKLYEINLEETWPAE